MFKRGYLLSLLCLTLALTTPHQTFGSTKSNSSVSLPLVIAGGACGGLAGYLFSWLFKNAMIEENQKKQKFLIDLEEYALKDEFINNTTNDRLFAHYYNGLNQLVQSTTQSDVSYLEDFSMCKDKEKQAMFLAKLKAFAQSIQKSHESQLFWNKAISIAWGAITGACIALGASDGDYHRNSYVGFVNYGSGAGNIFRPR